LIYVTLIYPLNHVVIFICNGNISNW